MKHLCVSTAGLTALSNMPVIGSSPVLVADDERSMADDDDSWIKDDFATTPVMSTYLLAFVVADFRSRQTTGHHGLKVRNNNNYYIIAKFHYTDPTGPDRTGPDQTKSADFVWYWLNSSTRARTDPRGPARTQTTRISENSVGPCGSPTKSVWVRAGPVGSGRARVVEFSLYTAPV